MAGVDAVVAALDAGPAISADENRKLIRGSALSLVGALATALAGLGLTLVLARSVSAELLGWFSLAQSWFLLTLAVAGLGTRTGLVFVASRLRAADELGRLKAVTAYAMGPVLAAAALACAGFWFGAGSLATQATAGSDTAAASLRFMALMLPAAVLVETLNAVSLGLGHVKPTVIIDRIARPLLQFVFVVAALWAGYTAWLVQAWAVAFVPLAVWTVWWMLRLWPDPAVRRANAVELEPADLATFGGFWRYTTPRAITTIVQAAMQRLDILLLGLLAGPVQAAIYTVATRFLVVAQIGNQSLSTVLQPRLASSLARRDTPRSQGMYHLSSGWLVLLTWPVLLVAMLFAQQWLGFFGSEYAGYSGIVLLLSGVMLFATLAGMNDVVLLMSGHSALGLVNHLVALSAMVAVDLLLIPGWGALGAAAGWGTSIALKNLLAVAQVWRTERLLPFGGESAAAAVITLVTFLAVPGAALVVMGMGWPAAVVGLGLGTALFAVLVWRFRDELRLAPGAIQESR